MAAWGHLSSASCGSLNEAQPMCRGHMGTANENQKLKRLVADLSLDKAMLQEVLAKKV